MSCDPCDPVDLIIPYGLTFAFGFQLTDQKRQPEDITGWSIAIQFRATEDATDTVLSITSSPSDCITITDAVTGQVDVEVPTTRTLLPRRQTGKLQAVMINAAEPTNIIPIFSGNYYVDPSTWQAP